MLSIPNHQNLKNATSMRLKSKYCSRHLVYLSHKIKEWGWKKKFNYKATNFIGSSYLLNNKNGVFFSFYTYILYPAKTQNTHITLQHFSRKWDSYTYTNNGWKISATPFITFIYTSLYINISYIIIKIIYLLLYIFQNIYFEL